MTNALDHPKHSPMQSHVQQLGHKDHPSQDKIIFYSERHLKSRA